MKKIKRGREKDDLLVKEKSMAYQLFLIIVGIVIGLFFNSYIIPGLSKNIFHREELLAVQVLRLGADSHLGNYQLAIENKSKSFDLENVYASMDFQFVIQDVKIDADQSVVNPRLSRGTSPLYYQNNQIEITPTNHLNMAADGIKTRGLFAISVFLNETPQSAAGPFTGLNPQKVGGKVDYSYTFWDVRIKRSFRFEIPLLQG